LTAYELSTEVVRLSIEQKFVLALPIAEKAVIQAEAEYGNLSTSTSNTVFNLAVALEGVGRTDEALKAYQRAVSIRNSNQNGKDKDEITFRLRMGQLLQKLGKKKEAVDNAIEIKNNVVLLPIAEALAIANSIIALAASKRNLGLHDDELSLQQQALSIRESRLGSRDALTIDSQYRVGTAYLELRRLNEAQDILTQAERASKLLPDSNGTGLADILVAMASVKRSRGFHSEELSLQQQALMIREQKLGKSSTFTADSLNRVAGAYQALSQPRSALSYSQRAVEILERLNNAESSSLAYALSMQANILSQLFRMDEASVLFNRAIQMFIERYGAHSAQTSDELSRYAAFLRSLNRLDESAQFERQSLETRRALFGDQSLKVAESYYSIAILERDLGNYDRAERLLLNAVEIRKSLLASSDPQALGTLYTLAEILLAKGQYEKALELHLTVLDQRRSSLPVGSLDIAISLNGVAGVLTAMARYSEAIAFLQESLSIRERQLDSNNPLIANALSSFASLDILLGNYFSALARINRAVQIRSDTLGPTDPTTAVEQLKLSTILHRIGKFFAAVEVAQQASANLVRVLGPNHILTAAGYANLGITLEAVGRTDQAIELWRKALNIRESVLGPISVATSNSLMDLGNALESSGQYEEALNCFERATFIRQAKFGPRHPQTADALNGLAGIYRSVGDFDRARELYTQALQIWRQSSGLKHPDTAVGLNNLASLEKSAKRLDRALDLYQQALEINVKLFGPTQQEVAVNLYNIADSLGKLGRAKEALPLAKRAYDINLSIRGPTNQDTATDLRLVARTLASLGRIDEALNSYRMAFASMSPKIYNDQNPNAYGVRELAEIAGEFAKFLEGRGEESSVAEAIFFYKIAVNSNQRIRSGAKGLSAQIRDSLNEQVSEPYTGLARLLVQEGRVAEAEQVLRLLKESQFTAYLTRQGVPEQGAGRSNWTVEERQLLANMDEIALVWREFGTRWDEATDKLRRGEITEGSQQWQNLIVQRTQVQRRTTLNFEEMQRGLIQARVDSVINRQRAYEQARTQISEALQNVHVRELERSSVAPRTAALTFLPGDRELLIMLTTERGAVPLVAKIGRADLNVQVAAFRKAIEQRADVKVPAQKLYEILIAPVLLQLLKSGENDIGQLLILGFESMRDLPFAALYDGGSKQYLIEKFALVTSTADGSGGLSDLEILPKKTLRGAVLGATKPHPAFGNRGLPAVSTEVCGIVKSGEDVACANSGEGALAGNRFLDENFSPIRLRALLSQPAIFDMAQQPNFLHIATHYDGKTLLLGGGNTLSSITLLKEWEPKVGQYDLIVLSACSSGIGGEGVENLGATMRNRGAKAVMATLWEVADVGAAPLMLEFYRRLGANLSEGKSQALRQAQIAMLRGKVRGSPGDLDLTAPYFWAPYVLMGNWL
jgi:CHAT domain-containing protein/Tfp pilus assembly protein PilF